MLDRDSRNITIKYSRNVILQEIAEFHQEKVNKKSKRYHAYICRKFIRILAFEISSGKSKKSVILEKEG